MPAALGVGIDRRVDDHHLEGAFLVPVVARQHLVPPDDFAGLRLDGKARVGAGHGGARHVALGFRGRADPARSVKDEIEFWIVGELAPHAGHPALFERRAGPGLVAGLARARDHRVAPQFLAGLGVVAGDIAAVRRHLAGAAGDDHAVDHDRAGRIADVEIAAAIGLPGQFAGAGLERDDEVVPGHEVDVVAIERDAALALPMVALERCRGRQRMPVFPEQVAVGGIDRLDHVARIAEIHDAVVDERASSR